ncbi:hypothetical protein EI165_14495 [Pseudoalteromonas nigrifaciens]|uniref:hypothetical protein n=1 Tax=Pseudoalteromonas nigrifaciens TaxID=28109 RepID=UPI0017880D8E|nr:hypothetical protein [Pseudoalteromonas nigrifaciens]MBE0421322.1 hypothetical protein [Pseudoalteromonas nigrifaciens]
MNTRKLAQQALNYLESLKSYDSPDCMKWHEQNKRDYNALLKLNKKGLGNTTEELEAMAKAPLTDRYAKAAIERIDKIERKITELRNNIEAIEDNPVWWKNFFSGYEVIPTAACKRKLQAIENRIKKYCIEEGKLMKSVTIEQAERFGMFLDTLEESDFYLPEEK